MGIFPQLLLEAAWDLLIINTGQCGAHTRHDFKCLDTIKIDESHLPPSSYHLIWIFSSSLPDKNLLMFYLFILIVLLGMAV